MVNKTGGKLNIYGPLRQRNGNVVTTKHLYITISEANILNNVTRVTNNGRFSVHDVEFWKSHDE